MDGASVVGEGPGWTWWRTPSGVWVEVADDLACVLPPEAAAGVVSIAWPRGRWRFTFRGDPVPYEAPMAVRADPSLTCAMTVLAAAKQAKVHGDADVRATFGELASREPADGLTAGETAGVLDVRAPTEPERDSLVDVVVQSIPSLKSGEVTDDQLRKRLQDAQKDAQSTLDRQKNGGL